MRMELRNWPATFQGEVLDLSSSPQCTPSINQDWCKKCGPISHLAGSLIRIGATRTGEWFMIYFSTRNAWCNQQAGYDDLPKINVLGVVSVAPSMYKYMTIRIGDDKAKRIQWLQRGLWAYPISKPAYMRQKKRDSPAVCAKPIIVVSLSFAYRMMMWCLISCVALTTRTTFP